MLQLDPVQTLAAGGLVLMLGDALKRLFPFLARYNLPGPVVGGMAVALLLSLLQGAGIPLPVFDQSLKEPLMVTFFASIGYGASWTLLRSGGPQVGTLLLVCGALAVLQNVLGAGMAWGMGLPPLFGVLAGSVTLTGGPGTGMAFAPAFERAGVPAAGSVAVMAAMGGIVLGGLLGGPLGTRLVERDHVTPLDPRDPRSQHAAQQLAQDHTHAPRTVAVLVRHLVVLLCCVWLGAHVSRLLATLGVTLPSYIGAMLVAAVVRNVEDRSGWMGVSPDLVEDLGSVALAFFLALSLMTLKLWELAAVALPLLVMLAVQCAVMLLLCGTLVYRVMGRDYDAAVMASGTMGFMMGTTANAMANMDALTRRYGPAPRAYLVAPMVGACFIDVLNSLLIGQCLRILG